MEHLFSTVGFAWTLRIVGMISCLGCGISVLTVTSTLPVGQKPARRLGTWIVKDRNFGLLSLGGVFVALGRLIALFH